MSVVDGVLLIAIVLVSIVLHENAHAVVALWLGDDTARNAGRITLNPIPHLDLVGSIILPAFMAFTTGGAFGYAKPVPINPWKLKGKDKWGFATVSLAGPVSNVLIAFVCLVLAEALYGIPADIFRQAGGVLFVPDAMGPRILIYGYVINMLLAAFNLVPIPPLDGSRLLRVFLSQSGRQMLDRVEPFGFVIILILIVWLAEPFFRLVNVIQSVLVRLLPV